MGREMVAELIYKIAKCCTPQEGDAITGYFKEDTEIKGVSMVKSPSGATLLRSENRKVSIEVPAVR